MNIYLIIKMKKDWENILTQVWKQWRSNYQLELKSAYQHHQTDQPNEIKENSVDLMEENTPQLIWKTDGVI